LGGIGAPHLDLAGYENVELSVLHGRGPNEFGNVVDTVSNDLWAGDAVQNRVEGPTLWKRILSLTGTDSTTTNQPFNLDLSDIASSYGDPQYANGPQCGARSIR